MKGWQNQYDYGARIYDPRAAKYLSVDPLQKEYAGITPYAMALNTPIQATDPDGNLVIFINGLWGLGTGAHDGGNKNYWSYTNQPGGWADAAMKQIGDYHARYYDGSSGGFWGSPLKRIESAEYRMEQGYKKGKSDAAAIIASLQRDPNNPNKITESVKFITNSMGAAYQRGFSKALKEYVGNYNKEIQQFNTEELFKSISDNRAANFKEYLTGFEMEFTVDLDAFQGRSKLWGDPNVTQNYFMRNQNEGIVPGAGFTQSYIEGGEKEIGVDSNGKPKSQGHHASFFPASDLPSSKKNSAIKKDINENK